MHLENFVGGSRESSPFSYENHEDNGNEEDDEHDITLPGSSQRVGTLRIRASRMAGAREDRLGNFNSNNVTYYPPQGSGLDSQDQVRDKMLVPDIVVHQILSVDDQDKA